MADRRPDITQEEPPNLIDAMGGPVGMAESALPSVAFIITYTASGQDTRTSAIVAVALALALTIIRLARRESPQQALAGLIGVAFAAFIADRSGKAENFFLPGLIANAAYASAFLVSIAIRRPLVGVLVSQLTEHGDNTWRDDPTRMKIYTRASWLWVAVFVVRLTVQLPLYLADEVVALGVARTAMGLPIFGIALYLTWLLVRQPGRTQPA